MKKKIYQILLAMGVTVLLAGCGNTQGQGEGGSEQQATDTVAGQTQKKVEKEESKSAENEQTQGIQESEIPEVDIEEEDSEDAQPHYKEVNWSEAAKQSIKALQQDIQTDNGLLGVAFLGWSGPVSGMPITTILEDAGMFYGEWYAFMEELENCAYIECPGEEVYLLLPVSEKYSVTVYEYLWNEESQATERGEVLLEGRPGEPVIVRCNQSDIMANIEVSVSGNSEAVLYHPALSLRDGKVSVESGTVDFTYYEEESGESGDDDWDMEEAFEDEAFARLQNVPVIIVNMKLGMSLGLTGEYEIIDGQDCLVFIMGTNHEENFVVERRYAVAPKGEIYYYDVLTDEWTTQLQ